MLCNARASANAAQNEGWAPLHIASRHGHAAWSAGSAQRPGACLPRPGEVFVCFMGEMRKIPSRGFKLALLVCQFGASTRWLALHREASHGYAPVSP